jgi:hypothetical protein
MIPSSGAEAAPSRCRRVRAAKRRAGVAAVARHPHTGPAALLSTTSRSKRALLPAADTRSRFRSRVDRADARGDDERGAGELSEVEVLAEQDDSCKPGDRRIEAEQDAVGLDADRRSAGSSSAYRSAMPSTRLEEEIGRDHRGAEAHDRHPRTGGTVADPRA